MQIIFSKRRNAIGLIQQVAPNARLMSHRTTPSDAGASGRGFIFSPFYEKELNSLNEARNKRLYLLRPGHYCGFFTLSWMLLVWSRESSANFKATSVFFKRRNSLSFSLCHLQEKGVRNRGYMVFIYHFTTSSLLYHYRNDNGIKPGVIILLRFLVHICMTQRQIQSRAFGQDVHLPLLRVLHLF